MHKERTTQGGRVTYTKKVRPDYLPALQEYDLCVVFLSLFFDFITCMSRFPQHYSPIPAYLPSDRAVPEISVEFLIKCVILVSVQQYGTGLCHRKSVRKKEQNRNKER